MKVAGLDLAMTATGLTHTAEGAACIHRVRPKLEKDARLPEIEDQIWSLINDAEFILIEMLPPSMKGAGITGMVQGIVRSRLQQEGRSYADIGPSALKKYATGKGNASKTEMALAAMKRGGLEIPENNECDAWWLWVMANDFQGQPVFPLPAVQRAELKKIERKG